MGLVDLKRKNVLVTGGCGYLGKNLVQNLVDLGAEVHSIDIVENHDHPEVNYHQVDLNNESLLNEKVSEIKPDLIYHLAANLNRSRDFTKTNEILKINLTGTVNLLNALDKTKYDNFIFISTSDIYGGEKIPIPIKEDCDFIPASPYSLSKYCAEATIKTFSSIHSKNYSILRVFNFFGPNMPMSFFVPQLIDKLTNNQGFEMTHGAQKRDFLHVSDVVEAMVLSSNERAYNQVFNICSGEGITIKGLAIKFKTLLNSKSTIHFGAIPYRKNEIWDLTGDNSKIKNVLGWKPRYSIFKDYLTK